MTAFLVRINARLDEIEAGPAVIGTAVFLASSIAALIWGGQTLLNILLIAAGAVLFWNGGLLHSRADEALDGNDQNSRRLDSLQTPAELVPVRGPDTRPAAAVLIDHAFDEAETGPIPVVLDDVDEALAAFSFAPGHVR